MTLAKFLLLAIAMAGLTASTEAGVLDNIFPTIMQQYYNFAPYKEGYRFNIDEPNGSKREEIGVIMNPGTEQQELVVMGSYTSYDEKTDTDTTVVYTADKDGYKPRVMIKNRKLSASALKSAAG